MARAQTVSLKEFTRTVQAAVKTAIEKHPKFKFEVPQEIFVSYLIRGIPPPPELLANATFSEVQAFANDIAAGLGQFQTESTVGAQARPQGVVYSAGGHIICGIPPAEFFALKE
jgi:hypothetical protein